MSVHGHGSASSSSSASSSELKVVPQHNKPSNCIVFDDHSRRYAMRKLTRAAPARDYYVPVEPSLVRWTDYVFGPEAVPKLYIEDELGSDEWLSFPDL